MFWCNISFIANWIGTQSDFSLSERVWSSWNMKSHSKIVFFKTKMYLWASLFTKTQQEQIVPQKACKSKIMNDVFLYNKHGWCYSLSIRMPIMRRFYFNWLWLAFDCVKVFVNIILSSYKEFHLKNFTISWQNICMSHVITIKKFLRKYH